jgi:hypothetical protein
LQPSRFPLHKMELGYHPILQMKKLT